MAMPKEYLTTQYKILALNVHLKSLAVRLREQDRLTIKWWNLKAGLIEKIRNKVVGIYYY